MGHSLHLSHSLQSPPDAATFGWDMLFDIPFIADWNKIGDYRQYQTDLNTARENKKIVNHDYKFVDRAPVIQDGILRKAQRPNGKEPWTIMRVHTNGTNRTQGGTKSEQINIRRVTPYYLVVVCRK